MKISLLICATLVNLPMCAAELTIYDKGAILLSALPIERATPLFFKKLYSPFHHLADELFSAQQLLTLKDTPYVSDVAHIVADFVEQNVIKNEGLLPLSLVGEIIMQLTVHKKTTTSKASSQLPIATQQHRCIAIVEAAREMQHQLIPDKFSLLRKRGKRLQLPSLMHKN